MNKKLAAEIAKGLNNQKKPAKKAKQWRQLGPEHDKYIDKQSTRAFVK